MESEPSAQTFMFRGRPIPLCDSEGVKMQLYWHVENPTERFCRWIVVCFMCEHESSYVYSYVCVKTSFLDDQLVRWFHFSIFGTLSQECCGKTGQEMESCDFSDQTCVNGSVNV